MASPRARQASAADCSRAFPRRRMESMSKARRLRKLLTEDTPVISPGVHDCYSAMLVDAMGFKTMAVSGSALSNSRIGQPDIGLLSLAYWVEFHFRKQPKIEIYSRTAWPSSDSGA